VQRNNDMSEIYAWNIYMKFMQRCGVTLLTHPLQELLCDLHMWTCMMWWRKAGPGILQASGKRGLV
jgi:hypothetical protein